MSTTALVFAGSYGGLLLLAFLHRPIWGLGAYLLAYYNHPPSSWWGGELPDLRWSLLAACVTALATLIQQRSRSESTSLPSPERVTDGQATGFEPATHRRNSGGFWLLLLFAAWMWVQTPWAINTSVHIEGAILYTKYVILFWIISRILVDIQSVEVFSWAHVVGCALWGWSALSAGVGGRLEMNVGPELADSNLVGFHLVTGLAFAGFLLIGLSGWRRWLALLVIPLILNAVVLTASRSATIGLAAAAVAALAFAPKSRRGWLYGCAILAIPLFLRVANSEVFWERMGTLQTTNQAEMDRSAASRFELMNANLQMFADHPLGAGHRGNMYLSPDYLSDEWLTGVGGQQLRSAHNTVLAILVDQGVPGVIVLFGLCLWIASRLLALKRLDGLGLPASYGLYRGAVAAGITAWVVSGLFVNLQRAEVFVWMLALLRVLSGLSGRAVEAALPPAQESGRDPSVELDDDSGLSHATER